MGGRHVEGDLLTIARRGPAGGPHTPDIALQKRSTANLVGGLMADTPHGPGPRVVRLSVSRPATTALSALVLGGALALGGGSAPGPSSSAGVTAAPTRAAVAAEGSSRPNDWDVTQRDLLVGQRDEGALTFVQVVATRLGEPIATGTATSVAAVGTPPGATQVPEVLWAAYRSAVSSVPTSCHLPVGLLAAIGQVESGSLAGRGLDAGHRAVPAVLGPVLDGHGYAAIPDTDGGRLDHDTTWDRAVGPMQFIPSTWARWGRDGNGDGARDPQNVEDSAWSAAAYLCAGGRDLSTGAGLRAAVLSYNHSAAYLSDVLGLARTMTPGGGLPQVAAAPVWTPPPFVGPPSRSPSRPPVVAAAAAGSSGSAGDGAAGPTGSATSATTTTATTGTPTTSASTASPTSTTTSTTTTSGTTPPTATATPATTTKTTTATTTSTSSSSSTTASPSSSTTTPSSSSATCPTGTPSTTTTSGGSGTTTSPTSTTSSSSPTTTPDPCATSTTTGTASSSGAGTSSGTESPSSSAPPATATTTSTEGPSAG
jgi:hypothetical protein